MIEYFNKLNKKTKKMFNVEIISNEFELNNSHK